LHLESIPQLLVLNKCDLLTDRETYTLVRQYDGILVSTHTRQGLDRLLQEAENSLEKFEVIDG
jgi:50S ribosomal subunit-associated GTPase HflX